MSRGSAGFSRRQENRTRIMAVLVISGKDDSRAFPCNVTGMCLRLFGMCYRIPFDLVCDAVQDL